MKQITVVLGIALCVSGCSQKSPDGLSREGSIIPITKDLESNLNFEELTDGNAYLKALEDIRDRSPPEDISSTISIKTRRDFYEKAWRKLLPTNSAFVLPIACISENGPLAYDKATKNLIVELSNYDPDLAANWNDRVVDHIVNVQSTLMADQVYILKYGSTAIGHNELGLPKSSEESLRDFSEKAQVIELSSGVKIAIANNPIGPSWLKLSIAIREAENEHIQFQIALLEDRQPEPNGFVELLQKAKLEWREFPRGPEMRPFFFRRIRFAGEPSNLCLAGKFVDVDLTNGGAGSYVMTDSSAQLYGILKEWYIIDRADGEVVARENFRK